ncbi:DUF1501 domain-containing protein [Urbifossiella limnaea]|uniref:DUF1501 domain-containing protein n=1 Tax=Urbifossiella limnaea TaxID=2528023 RepID=A0A517Y2B8_9BACT|nr:DUF1501 domain-containing protein [Urbifossiella limnaea]QDU23879.1 hypothetical protein ETAA1_58890 [Urbifossiella limnaea]
MTRRDALRSSALGFGWLALADLLAAADPPPRDPLAPRPPHFTPKAKRVIFLFMHGGPSQVDTFDHKPRLAADDGKPLPFPLPRVVSSATGSLLKSPFAFRQHGQSGAWASELFPHIAARADDLCFIKSMHGSNSRHGGALLELHTGSDTFVRPSMGSWVTYGLGTEGRDLPGFVSICPTLTHGGVNNYSSAFLPAAYQATPLGNAGTPAGRAAVPFVRGTTPPAQQRLEIDLLADLERQRTTAPDAAAEGRIQSFETAFRMQAAAPLAQDLSKETAETHRLYGIDEPATENFGRQCLMARRFAEAGVRFVQCTHSYKWDQHENLKRDHTTNAREVDKPVAGLLADLKRRGLLADTLVIWGGEFGRTPVAQGKDGRDHNPHGFTMFLAGGGVKAGHSHGATDDYGYFAVENKVHVHDLHATMLHLLGLDHTRLTYRHAGRDFRLTDVHGEVVREVLA